MTRSVRIAGLLRGAAPLTVVGFAAAVLFRLSPGRYWFYPQCPVHRYLHVECPGCGTTRALAALLHGNLVEALRSNALTTLLVPLAVIYGAICYVRFLQRKDFRMPQPTVPVIYAGMGVAAIFMVIRNLGHF